MAKRPPTARPSSAQSPGNQLLAALPAAEYARIAPSLETIPLKLQEQIHKPGEPIRHVYFPAGGFCSVLAVLEDGTMVEVATIGREGAVGVSAIFDGDGTASRSLSMVQAAAETCYRMPVEVFRQEMDRRGTFYELMTRYTQALLGLTTVFISSSMAAPSSRRRKPSKVRRYPNFVSSILCMVPISGTPASAGISFVTGVP